MQVSQILENEVNPDLERARSVAGASFMRGGLKYDWVGTYSKETYDRAQQRCQELQASGRSAILVQHSNGNFTIWWRSEGPSEPRTPERLATAPASAVMPQQPEPEPQTVLPGGNSDTLKISILRILFANYVGPAAGMVCDRLLARGITGFEAMVDALTQKVLDPEDAKKFVLDARRIPATVLTRLQDLAAFFLGPAGITESNEVFVRASNLPEAIAALAEKMPNTKAAGEFERGAQEVLVGYSLNE